MSKKDRLNKEIDLLREKRKDWFYVLLSLVSAIIILVYAVITGDKPLYILFIAIIGLLATMPIALYYKKIESDLETKLDDLEKEL